MTVGAALPVPPRACRGAHVKAIAPEQAGMQRIFISYRRGDSQWVAGRLADTLGDYFGDKRVFRDVEGIAGGADFGEVIRHTLGSADAVVVLIGPEWLEARDADGRRRLDDADDWVAHEVSAALEAGVPVYPVLVEGTPMPRAEELPESLRALARFNAISISDSRWREDVARLAKIIALDIPSATARQLQRVNLLVSTALFVAMALTLSVVLGNLLEASSELSGSDGRPQWRVGQLFESVSNPLSVADEGRCVNPPGALVCAARQGLGGPDFPRRSACERAAVRLRAACRSQPPPLFSGGGMERRDRHLWRLHAVQAAVRGIRSHRALLPRDAGGDADAGADGALRLPRKVAAPLRRQTPSATPWR